MAHSVWRRWGWLLMLSTQLVGRAGWTQPASPPPAAPDTARLAPPPPDTVAATDMGDVLRRAFPRLRLQRPDSVRRPRPNELFVVVLPLVSYTVATRGLAQLTSSTVFRLPSAHTSTVNAAATYTQNQQALLNVLFSIWTPDNTLNWVGDWRLMHYPQNSYGLGVRLDQPAPVFMNYEYLRVYQSVLRKVRPGLSAGVGYQLDYRWNIRSQVGSTEVSAISGYAPGVQGRSVSSGVAATLLFDNRGNTVNPLGGTHVNLVVRANARWLGSDAAYNTVLLDARHYLRPRPGSTNVLALWSYSALVLDSGAPFLDLPSNGWDAGNNTGRGYVQGRFRGERLLYAEAEYRFRITANRLLGGVCFLNAQTVSEPRTWQFQRVAPAAGAGLRLNLNKTTRTNLGIDYGVGLDGSRGLWFNFGEVF